MNNNGKRPGFLKVLLVYILIFVAIAGVISMLSGGSLFNNTGETKSIEFSQLIDYLDKKEVTEITISASSRSYTAKLKSGDTVVAYAPTEYDMMTVSETYIVPQSAEGTLIVKSVRPSSAACALPSQLVSRVPFAPSTSMFFISAPTAIPFNKSTAEIMAPFFPNFSEKESSAGFVPAPQNQREFALFSPLFALSIFTGCSFKIS